MNYLRQPLPDGDPFPVADGPCRFKMDQNESPWDLPDELKWELSERLRSMAWSRYPQPAGYLSVKKNLATVIGIPPDWFALTAGCDGAIQGIHFLAGGPGRRALVCLPTYPMLHHAAWLAGTAMEFRQIGPKYMIEPSFFSDQDLILIANPNNPTGTLTSETIILHALDTRAMVFVDEAYVDFSGITMVHSMSKYPNLAIGRSFSKTMLAGIRLGILAGHPEMIRRYESLVTAPYHLSHMQLVVADNYNLIRPCLTDRVRTIVNERNRMLKTLESFGIQTYASNANFILMKLPNPKEIYEMLLKEGIRLRNMCKIQGLESHLRVTVGQPVENDVFLRSIQSIISNRHS
ncbi:aminotransferase class I/II-fold pyridoxal phosphate-dependent enzyme [bacterium]|nr:aminotransferase class I/II-fold pyridoxal phosphate-dependent enzyme [candidate division CSSED10-310 bacterium]